MSGGVGRTYRVYIIKFIAQKGQNVWGKCLSCYITKINDEPEMTEPKVDKVIKNKFGTTKTLKQFNLH